MDNNLDNALLKLAAEPLPPSLDQLESKVMMRINAERREDAGATLRPNVLAAIGAISLGIAASGLSSAVANAQSSTLSPFGPSMPLAPSTLLTAK